MRALYHRVYLAGYGGWNMPRALRRAIAGSELHRAWVLGKSGYFQQGEAAFGLAAPYPAQARSQRPALNPTPDLKDQLL